MPKASDQPAHDLMPEDMVETIPRLYACQNENDPIAHVKLFTPDSNWIFYIAEFDPEDRICFGLVVGPIRELGYFSLEELEGIRGPLGLPVERGLYWTPCPLSKCR